MAGPLRVLLAGPTAATIEAEEDVDGAPPGGCYMRVRQWPPLKLKKMSMVGPLGEQPACPAAATIEEEDVDGGPLGVQPTSSAVATLSCRCLLEQIFSMSGPLGAETHGHPTTSHGRHLCRAPLEVMLVPGAALHLVMLGIDGGTMAPCRGPDPSVA
jgi:hypothetical protein